MRFNHTQHTGFNHTLYSGLIDTLCSGFEGLILIPFTEDEYYYISPNEGFIIPNDSDAPCFLWH